MSGLDIGLLGNLSFVFSFILVWSLVYAILGFTKIFDAGNHLRALVAMVASLLVLLAPPVLMVIQVVVPWFVLMFVLITFLLMGLMIFGITKEDISKFVKTTPDKDSYNVVQIWIIILSVLIAVGGIGLVFFSGGEASSPSESDSQDQTITESSDGTVGGRGPGEVEAIFFHPKVLGVIFIMLLAVFASVLLAK